WLHECDRAGATVHLDDVAAVDERGDYARHVGRRLHSNAVPDLAIARADAALCDAAANEFQRQTLQHRETKAGVLGGHGYERSAAMRTARHGGAFLPHALTSASSAPKGATKNSSTSLTILLPSTVSARSGSSSIACLLSATAGRRNLFRRRRRMSAITSST